MFDINKEENKKKKVNNMEMENYLIFIDSLVMQKTQIATYTKLYHLFYLQITI